MPRSTARVRRLVAPTTAWVLALACVACSRTEQTPGGAGQPVTVLVTTVTASPTPNIVELPGRIEAVRTAEVRARVDGIVERRLYQEGTDVAAGAPLFQIDARDYRAQLQQAQATLQRTEAVQVNAAAVVARFKPLVQRQAVSAQEYEEAVASLQQAQANVSDAHAQVDLAQLRLDRCIVTAPIAGRVGRAQVTEGALVSGSAATLLTQVNQLSPISAVFTQSNTSLLDFQQLVASGALKAADRKHVEVQLILANGQEYGERGFLDFTDLVVEPSTGTQTVRAQFANPARTLLPGQFVRGRIVTGTLKSGIRVPERAIQIDNGAASVAIVADDGSVVRRNVELGAQDGGEWIILDGLKTGERVIVDGWHKVQPGMRVNAQPAPASPPPTH
ncbi:efflux RND transporter periplasmic adaptor subunit [Dyella halodurans]|uniref:Efflux RND transporter periplasmic adaptor subunit n=1 Tax=Dyella halodurans TaxID=1920171 RepID=A0ABV9BYH2_9GAMM|nr:efflux RND transporter periplasmic adaptor subunit [Dyella halodurans]